MAFLDLKQLADLVEIDDERRPEEGRYPLYKIVLAVMRMDPIYRDRWEVRLVHNSSGIAPLRREAIEALDTDARDMASLLGE